MEYTCKQCAYEAYCFRSSSGIARECEKFRPKQNEQTVNCRCSIEPAATETEEMYKLIAEMTGAKRAIWNCGQIEEIKSYHWVADMQNDSFKTNNIIILN